MPFAYSDAKLAKTGTYLDNQPAVVPGPGAYNTNISTLRKQDVHIRIKTEPPKMRATPGPADYVPRGAVQSGDAPSMRLQPARKTFFDELPNPTKELAHYEFNTSTLRRRSKSISGRNQEPITAVTPGPAEYRPNQQQVAQRRPAYSISVTTRKVFEASKDQRTMPGPADFSKQQRSLQERGAGTFAKEGLMFKNQHQQNPGVGAYQIAARKSGSAGFTFGSRRAVGEHF